MPTLTKAYLGATQRRVYRGANLIADAAPAPATPILLLVAGQSNARKAGATPPTGTEGFASLAAQQWVDGSAAFAPYDIGVNSGHKGTLDSGSWGSEAEFIRQANAEYPGRTIYVVKEAVNGQTVRPTTGGDWAPGNTGERFSGLEAQVTAARAAIGVACEEITLWNQGEGDSNLVADAIDFRDNAWPAFLTAYRSRISSGLFVTERIRPRKGGDDTDHWNAVAITRKAQLDEMLADANGRCISTDFQGVFTNLHPGNDWIIGCGARGYAAWRGTYDATYGAITDAVTDKLIFTNATDVATNEVSLSGQIQLDDISQDAAISVTGGEYRVLNPSIDSEAGTTTAIDWTSVAGRVHPYQIVQLRQTASASASTTTTATLTIGTVSASRSVTTAAIAASYEPETDAFISRAAAVGAASMTTPQKQALDDLYAGLKADALLGTKIKTLRITRMHDSIASRLEMVDQTTMATYEGVGGNLPWTLAGGFNGQGASNMGLNLQFNPSANVLLNDAGLFIWSTTGSTGTAPSDVNSADGTFGLRLLTGTGRAWINTSSNQNLGGQSDTGPGFVAVNRKGATDTRLYKTAGTPTFTQATPSAALTATKFYLGASNGSGNTSDRGVGAVGAFTGMTDADVLALRNRLDAFFTAFHA